MTDSYFKQFTFTIFIYVYYKKGSIVPSRPQMIQREEDKINIILIFN